MLKSYKYRLLPNKEQMVFINRCIGCARFVYNNLLFDYKQQLANKVEKPKIKNVTFLKEEYTFLKDVDSYALLNAKEHLAKALTNFFRTENKTAFPKRHKKSKCKLSYTTNNNGRNLYMKNNMIRLPKMGLVNLIYHRELKGIIKSATITQERNGDYYISILTDYNHKPLNRNKPLKELNVVGIDMSYSNFAIDSDNGNDVTKPKFIRHYRKSEKKIARLHRQMSRKARGSKSRNKVRIKLANMYRKIANRHKDFCHKISKYYASKYDVIVLEDLNLSDMKKSHLRGSGKSISDMCFGMFKDFLTYKCEMYDSCLMFADKWFPSSKICNHCGCKNESLKLNDRQWVCPNCGHTVERDINAALNLKDYFFKVIDINTAGTVEINATGEQSTTLRETLMQVCSVKAEAPKFRWARSRNLSINIS